MNIEQAINILAQCSPDNHKNFKKQIYHYQVELTSPLKDYLDFIDIDVLEWLNTSPENYKAESTFYAFRSPVITLLKHKDVIAEYGEQYCTSLAKNISLVFSQNIDSIIKARNNTIIIEDKSDTESDNDSDKTDDDTQSVHSSLDINALTNQDKNKNEVTKTDNDFKKQYETLKYRYDNLQQNYDALMKDHQYVKGQYERTNTELERTWEHIKDILYKLAPK